MHNKHVPQKRTVPKNMVKESNGTESSAVESQLAAPGKVRMTSNKGDYCNGKQGNIRKWTVVF